MASTGSRRKAGQAKRIAAYLAELGKLGLGTMTHPETERWIARTIVFARMEKLMVGDLRNLRDNALPLYQALYELGRRMLPCDVPALEIRERMSNDTELIRRHYVDSWSSLSQAANHFVEAEKLADAVTRWTGALNMTTDWFRDVECTPKVRQKVKGPNTLNGEVYGFGPASVQP